MANEFSATIQAVAEEPQDVIVAILRDRSITVSTLHGAVYELPSAQCLPLYRAIFDLYPTVPDASEDDFSQPRSDYIVARVFAGWAALELDDVPLALRLLEPVLPLTSEVPFIAHTAAWALLRSGRPGEALDQVKIAVETGSDLATLETAKELAELHDHPAFQQIFRDGRERRAMRVLRQWPAGVPIPPRLLELAHFITGPGGGNLGDYDTDDLDDDYLAWIWGNDDREAFMKDFERHPPKIAFFLRDGGGGELGLWMHGEPSDWPVVAIDSEGTHEVRGESLDDFLCIVTGAHESNDDGRFMDARDDVRAWVRSLGLAPYERPADRFPALRRRTLEFLRWCAEERRSILTRVLPSRQLTVDAEPGVRVGPIRFGAPQSEVDAALGAPRFAKWDDEEEPLVTAFYKDTYVVEYDRATRTVAEVTLYARSTLLRFPGAFEPLLATAREVERWLEAQSRPFAFDRGELTCPSLGLTFSLRWSTAGREPDLEWVHGVTMRRQTSA